MNSEEHSTSLDNPEVFATLDPSGFGKRLLDLPSQATRGWELGSEIPKNSVGSMFDRILVGGMGGSAIGAALVQNLVDIQDVGIEVIPWRDYTLPSWATKRTLLIAISVSGNTRETNMLFRSAIDLGIPRIAMSGPGALLATANEEGTPSVRIEWSHEPRAALGFTFVALYRILMEHGLAEDISADALEAIADLKSFAAEISTHVPSPRNVAKQMALTLSGHHPLIVSQRSLAGVAIRWKSQINENADCWAGVDQIPELKHNTIQGIFRAPHWPQPPSVIILKDNQQDPQIEEDIWMIRQEFLDHNVPVTLHQIEGSNQFGRILKGALMGDMVSYYLAMLRGRNPSITESLNNMKKLI